MCDKTYFFEVFFFYKLYLGINAIPTKPIAPVLRKLRRFIARCLPEGMRSVLKTFQVPR
jgi:hypothetical protein